MHRDLHGEKNDHALVECVWSWRIRSVKPRARRDFACLYTQERDRRGNLKQTGCMQKFEKAVDSKLAELEYDAASDSATKMYEKMCAAIHFAIDTILPIRRRGSCVRRKVSEKTKDLYTRRSAMRNQGTHEQFAQIQKEIKESGLADFENWVREWADVIDDANKVGDTRGIYKGVNALAQKQNKPPTNLNTDSNGNILQSAEDVAATWYQFLKKKFAATPTEQGRPEMETLPCTQGEHGLTDIQFKRGLAKMSNDKATGPDRIPAKLYKQSPYCQTLLRQLIQKMWLEEEIPTAFARATFVMLHKNKGSKDDPTKYRCIGLLNHSYKVFNQCLLRRLETETASFLSEWQAGFRRNRGCRDNILTLRSIYDEMLEEGRKLYVSFIDYSAAFDSVSHKFIDKALKAAGASPKSRALFRAIYEAASATTRVQGTDGAEVLSESFPINRGVVQGDITSPLYFILALELILRTHDTNRHKGIKFGNVMVDTLGYADDAALLDTDVHTATERVTSIARGSEQDADMKINVGKTEVMHVEEQDSVAQATSDELRAECKFTCPNVDCKRVFHTAHGCKCHAGRCRRKGWFEVDRILDVKGATGSNEREFLIRWKGYGAEHDQWRPRRDVHPDLINEYLHANSLYDHEWPGDRCPWCDKPCKNARGVQAHMRWCGFKPDVQNFEGTCAAKAAKLTKLMAAQKNKDEVLCDGVALKNVFQFKYLGSIFAADGTNEHDVRRRIALAKQRMGTLRHVFNSSIPLPLKLKIYKTAICSLLTYGSEAWTLDEKTLAMINGANARCLSWFTGKDAHAEASTRTRTYDLVAAIRKRRFVWLGHILRMEGNRLVKHAVARQHSIGLPGNMFYDVPPHLSFKQVEAAASDRKLWKRLGTLLRPHDSTDTSTKRLQMANMTKLLPAPPPTSIPPRRMGATTRASARMCARTVSSPIAITTKAPSSANAMKKYRSRDAHALFFGSTTSTRAKMQCRKKPKPVKPKGLTDAQRAAEAHAHYIINHGTEADAEKFIKHRRIRNVCTDTLSTLQGMRNAVKVVTTAPSTSCTTPTAPAPQAMRRPVRTPTWKEAAVAVFSSSSEEGLALTPPSSPVMSTSMTVTPLPLTPVQAAPTSMLPRPIPTWKEAAAAVFDSSSGSDLDLAVTPSPSPTTPPLLTTPSPIPAMSRTPLSTSTEVPLMAAAALDSSIFSNRQRRG